MKSLFLLVTVSNLFLVGALITLRSGVVEAPIRQRLGILASNLGAMIFRVIGYLVGLLVVQRVVGFPVALPW